MLRRSFLRELGGHLMGLSMMPYWALKPVMNQLPLRTIPSTGETIPTVGLGSWITFDVAGNDKRMNQMGHVLHAFVEMGGQLVDSSPMYGSSEKVIGQLSVQKQIGEDLFVATKVWTNGANRGRAQIAASMKHFHKRIRLLQIHNIRDFNTHFPYLQSLKAEGTVKYIGVTHYLNSAHSRLEELVQKYPLDFLQINYNVENPSAENRLLAAAADRGVAVIINRPFQTGRLFRLIQGKELPNWTLERGVQSWAAYFLKYILSNPHVTCTIPATTQVPHVRENLTASSGWMPSWSEHLRMAKDFRELI